MKQTKKCYFAVDLGGTFTKFGLFDENGKLEDKWSVGTRTEGSGKYIINDIADQISKKCSENELCREQIYGIGLAVPGPVDSFGRINGCVNLGWHGMIDAGKKLSEFSGYHTAIGNDATLAALGEYSYIKNTANKEMRENAIFMTFGTGVGGGIIIDGNVVYGAHGAAGEIGHMKVSAPEALPCKCGRYGCLEQYASATGIVRLVKKRLEPGDEPSLLRNLDHIECKDVFDAAKAGDKSALSVINEVFGYAAEALAAITCVIDPDMVILGGGVSKAGKIFLDGIEEKYKEKCFHACKDVRFYLATLGNDAGIYGAFELIRSKKGAV